MATAEKHTPPGAPERYPGGAHWIGEGVHAWLTPNGSWGESNTVLVSGHEESLLVDTLWDIPRTAAMLAGFRPQLEGAPIAQVVNTHADSDHWFGNQLTGAGRIIATKTAARHMRRQAPRQINKLHAVCRLFRAMSHAPIRNRDSWRVTAEYIEGMMRPFDFSNIRAAVPNATFTGKMQVEVGGRNLLLVDVGPAHTSGDLVVFLPDERIVAAGDIVFQGCTPILWDGSSRNWIKACQRILGWKVDLVVPGHGPLTDLSGVDAIRKYWQFLRAAVRSHYEKSVPPFRAALRIATSDEYLKHPFALWDCQERIAINVHSIYRRLMGRSRRIGTLERLMLLRETALMAKELAHRAGTASLASNA